MWPPNSNNWGQTVFFNVFYHKSDFFEPTRVCRSCFVNIDDPFKGHTDVVQDIKLYDNDAKLLSAGNDMVIRQWDFDSGKCLKEYKGHEGFIYSLSVLPRNKGFISSGEDRSLRVWSWENAEPEEQGSAIWATGIRNPEFL